MTLANKYRPQVFEDVTDQDVCTKVLSKQIENKSYSHALLFAGNAGCGKTTCARIFANAINGEIIELDCASHNGVAEIKDIVSTARTKPLIKDYKVIILDECHCLTKESWASLLIVLEENIKTAVFIFCTTDTQKIPNTIISRVQRLNFLPITHDGMLNRLHSICNDENISINDDALEYIIFSANGNLRQALTNLDKCLLYSESDLSVENVCKALNIVSTNVMRDICKAYGDGDIIDLINLIESVYNNGYELHQFIRQLLDYCLSHNLDDLTLINRLLVILQDIRYDDSPKNIIIARLIS